MTVEEVISRLCKKKLTLLSDYTRPEDIHSLRCHCGTEFTGRLSNYVSSSVKSCGCALRGINAKDISNTRFGRLLAVRDTGKIDKYGNHLWICKCDCGRDKTTQANYLLRGTTKSCGNCKLMRNGKGTSRPALTINRVFPTGIHNYQALPKVNVDIALIEEKIAIEYNGWYYHKDTKEKDTYRMSELLSNGWKVLIIEGREAVPTVAELLDLVSRLKNTETKYIIHTMNDWVKP